MNNLTTRKIVLGMLMMLVLVFSVQGIADALTFRATSSETQSARMGSRFNISFSISPGGNNVIAYHPTYSNRRINAGNHGNEQYIDSDGYEVTYIGETRTFYRNTTGTPESNPPGGLVVVDPRPTYNDETPGAAGNPNITPGYLVDNSGNLYDADGKVVYIQRGGGTRAGDNNLPPDNRWTYTRATLSNTTDISTATKVADDSALYDYNDEAIEFLITPPAGGSGTLKLTNPSYVLPGRVDDQSGETENDVTSNSLQERVGTIGLPTSINLVYEDASEGTHTIKVWDATPIVDFPLNAVPSVNRPRQPITFTILVTPVTTTIGQNDTISVTSGNERVPTDSNVEPVSALLTFPALGNNRIRYEVVRGSGTLYVGTFIEQHTTPLSAISVHQSSHVYLNTNGSSNEIHVSFAGEDRSAPRATLIFEYRGQPVPTTRTAPPPQPTQQTPRLTIFTSGEGTTRTVTVNAITAAGTSFPGVLVTLSSTDFSLSQAVTTGTPITVTLPTTAGSYTLFGN